MITIHKFELNFHGEPIDMPADAAILHVGEQKGVPYAWAKVDTDKPMVKRRIMIFGTGQPLLGADIYLGTIHVGGFVWHLYESLWVGS